MPSASWTTASWLPVSGVDVKTSSHVTGRRTSAPRSLVEVEVARRALLEPQAVVVGRLLEKLRRLLEHVLGLVVRGHDVAVGLRGLVGGGRRRVRRWRRLVGRRQVVRGRRG